MLYLPEEGKICETLNQIKKKKKNMDICPISTWNANTLWVFMCTIVVYTNKGVLKLQQLLEVLFKYTAWIKIKLFNLELASFVLFFLENH